MGIKSLRLLAGGALLSNNVEALQRARFLATQAKDNAPHYEHTQMGYNYRMSNIAAAIGVGQLKVLDQRVAARRSNHDFYQALFANVEGVQFLEEPEGYFSNRWLSCIIIDSAVTGVSREDLRVALEKKTLKVDPYGNPCTCNPCLRTVIIMGLTLVKNSFKMASVFRQEVI